NLIACGGGTSGSDGSSSGSSTPPPALTIATPGVLVGALQGQPYSVTIKASGGQSPYQWAISPVSATTLFVTGLTINASTGVLSGTANFQGTGAFIAQVTDAASHTATQTFSISASAPLQALPVQSFSLPEFLNGSIYLSSLITGGVQPLSYTLN